MTLCTDVRKGASALSTNPAVRECIAASGVSLVSTQQPISRSIADAVCSVAACRQVFTAIRHLNLSIDSDCSIYGDSVLLVRDVLTPLATSPQCLNATDGSYDDEAIVSFKPPIPRSTRSGSPPSSRAAIIISIVLGIIMILAILAGVLYLVLKRRQKSPHEKRLAVDVPKTPETQSPLTSDMTAPLTSPVWLPKPSRRSSVPVPVPSAPTASQTSRPRPSAPPLSQTAIPAPSAPTASHTSVRNLKPSAPTATPSLFSDSSTQLTACSLIDSLSCDETLLSRQLYAEDIQDIRVIGSGGHGVVYLVWYQSTQLLASKRLVQDRMTVPKLRAFIEEIQLVASLEHPCIVAFVGVAWTNEYDLQALFAYMPHGDLCTHLATTRTPDLSWDPAKLQIALDIVHALVYVHSFSPPLVHRDLKSRNVLLDAGTTTTTTRAKLCDFGVSRYQSDALTMTTGVGTSRWLAPEVISGGGEYNERCDIYSFGMVLVELDTHRLPFAGLLSVASNSMAEMAILQQVSEGTLQPTLSATCPPSVLALARQCLAFDPTQRPTAMEVAYALRTIATGEFRFDPLH